ncbi:MAG: energy transducer TonB [Acidobacteriaceae bacterium]
MIPRRFFSTLILVALTSALAANAQDADARQRIEDLAKATSLVREGVKPWHLRMSFQLNDLDGKPKESGTIEEWWASSKSHRLVIASPSYNLTEPSTTVEPEITSRERYLVRKLIDQVVDPIPHYGAFENLKVTEAKRKFGKVELSCLSVSGTAVAGKLVLSQAGQQFCVDPGTTALRIVVDSGSASSGVVRNKMAKFRDIELGLDNTLSYGGKAAITGHIDVLESFSPDKATIQSVSSAEPEPATIPGIVTAGRAVKKNQPEYPEAARRAHISGSVVLCAIISKQGTIRSLYVVASPDRSLSQSAMDAVKTWVYVPYLLNGNPTEVDTTVIVNFNLSPYPY